MRGSDETAPVPAAGVLSAVGASHEHPHLVRNEIEMCFEHEVAAVQKMQLHVLEVTPIGVRSRRGEDAVADAPKDQGWGLMLAKGSLPFRILGQVRSVRFDKSELNFLGPRSIQEKLVLVPAVPRSVRLRLGDGYRGGTAAAWAML